MKIKKFLIIASLAVLMLIIGISSGILIEYKTDLFKKDQKSECENKDCNKETSGCDKDFNKETSTYKITLSQGTINIPSEWYVTKSYSEVNDLRNEGEVVEVVPEGFNIKDTYTNKVCTLNGLWPIHKKTITEISKENSHITIQYESSLIPGLFGITVCQGEIEDFSNYVIVKKSNNENDLGIARIKKDGMWKYIPYTYSPNGDEQCGNQNKPIYYDMSAYNLFALYTVTYQGDDSNLSETDNMIKEYLLQVYKNQ